MSHSIRERVEGFRLLLSRRGLATHGKRVEGIACRLMRSTYLVAIG